MKMLCCAGCIGDPGFQVEVFPTFKNEIGDCDFCHAQNVQTSKVEQFRDSFEFIISAYKVEESGSMLVDLLRADWLLFPDLSSSQAKELVAEILDNGEIVRKRFVPILKDASDHLSIWDGLSNELKSTNRYFPKTDLNHSRIVELLSHIIVKPGTVSENWYRSRIQEGPTPYPPEQMGAPPARKATHGRANPAGIPYLYLASDSQTAIAEVRPHPGDQVSVANFKIPDELKLIDLRNPRKLVSPFRLADESELSALRKDVSFLEHLGTELTKPVLPAGAAIDYVPTQYLCELIKNSGYDGVVYRSSQENASNLALFDPNLGKASEVAQQVVTGVSVSCDSVSIH